MALRVFTSCRGALESVRGTDLTPTRLIYGEEFIWEQTVATIRPTELRNSYAPVFSAAAGPELNRLTIRGRVTYEDMAWLGQLFFKAVSATGANPYVYTFLPTLTSDDVKTLTVQLGYSDTIATTPAIKLNGLIGESLNVHWEKNDDGAMTYEAVLVTATASSQITAFTGSLSDRTTTFASCNNTTVYSDAGGTIGSTSDDSFVSVDWTLNLNPVPLYTLNAGVGAEGMYRPNHRTWSATLRKKFENDTHWDDFQDKTTQKIRVTTTTGASAIIQADLYGTYTGRSLAEVDGIGTEELTLEQIYDSTSTSDFNWAVTNTVATIT
jgi:hypothetical protein